MQAYNCIVLIGPTGAGKSTVADQMAKSMGGIPLISSGDIARKLALQDTYTRAGLQRGDYAPELVIRMEVNTQIEAALATQGEFVIEGFPRKLEQLVLMESLPVHPLYVLLEVDLLVCIRRIVQRARKDDHSDAVAERLRHWTQHTIPMVDVLQSCLLVVDGLQEPTDIVSDVIHKYRSASL